MSLKKRLFLLSQGLTAVNPQTNSGRTDIVQRKCWKTIIIIPVFSRRKKLSKEFGARQLNSRCLANTGIYFINNWLEMSRS